jgi:hypothetical protein
MLIFYAGTYGYIGQLDFTDKGCCYDEPSEIKASMNISAAIPVHEEDASNIVGKLTEGGLLLKPHLSSCFNDIIFSSTLQ